MPTMTMPTAQVDFTGVVDAKVYNVTSEISDSVLIDCGNPRHSLCTRKWCEDLFRKRGETVPYEYVHPEIFTFGGGKQFSSNVTVKIPVNIGQFKGNFKFFVLDDSSGIPPLLSKTSLQVMKGVIDAEKSTLYFKGLKRVVRLRESSSGHWIMPLGN